MRTALELRAAVRQIKAAKLSLQPLLRGEADSTQPRCANAHGFSLHVRVRCGAH
jgi:hypothetical protein